MTPQDDPTPTLPDEVAASADVYADRTVNDVKTVVRDALERDALDTDDLADLYRYEATTKDRVTLLDWLADRIRDAGGEVPHHPDHVEATRDEFAATEADMDADVAENPELYDALADDDAETEATARDVLEDAVANAEAAVEQAAADAADEDDDYDPDATTVVTVRAQATGYYGGVWFDNAGTQVIDWDDRVAGAVERGDLELVAVRDETAIPPALRP